MKSSFQIKILDRQQVVHEDDFSGVVVLGRQNETGNGEPEEVYRCRRLDAERWRLVVARCDERNVSREHAVIEPIGADRIRLINRSNKLTIPVQQPVETVLPKCASLENPPAQELTLPCTFHLGPKTIRIQAPEEEPENAILQSLSEVVRPPGRFLRGRPDRLKSLREAESAVKSEGLDVETLVRWLQATIDVLQDAATANDFFQKAAEAMVENVGLDTGWVLMWDADQNTWLDRAFHADARQDASERRPSRKFLNLVRQERRTTWKTPDPEGSDATYRSLAEVKAVVAAPILDRDGEVIGALYGDRRQGADGETRFSKLEALLVELLAGGVATGLARLEQEAQAAQAQGQFEQFFGRSLAEELRQNPDLMEGREAEITILFADIRNFSGVSRTLGHKSTFDWINFVMQTLSECVVEQDGLVVDYIGDALMAMWGAPKPDPDHAAKACRAALSMVAAVSRINEAWSQLPEHMGLGVGVNTGLAQIGNTGSKVRFKYGPLGDTVNLASRVEGATKYLKTSLIVTESTRRKLGDAFACRRLCAARVVNIETPVVFHEIVDPSCFTGDWFDLERRYAAALEAFEQAADPIERAECDARFREAARILGNLLIDYPHDGPSLVLMKRAVNSLIEGPDSRHPVWELAGK